MNYIESKLSLIGFIQEGIDYVLTKNSDSTKYEHLTLYDLFAGTGDSMFYSYVLTKHYIGNCGEISANNSILDELDGYTG